MIKLSRGAWLALAAIVAIPATVAIAKTYEHSGWHRMSPETRARLDEGRLAMAKTALKLTPEQDKLWASVEVEVRNEFEARQEKISERQKMRDERKAKGDAATSPGPTGETRRRGDLAERFDKMSTELSQRADRMKAFTAAFKPFYVALSDDQKDVLRPLIRDLAPGFGGPRGKGPRMAHGGWGGHHGKRDGGKDTGSDDNGRESRDSDAADAPAKQN
ncbi:MAG: Spy/CpxP family protein refolding chaperone [Hyphomicrobium sp.]|nr:Spy/CpxP family protein refolding chaperone [Hyphomicrobium sp.]